MEHKCVRIPLAVITRASARPIAPRISTSARAVIGWLILLIAMTAIAGCSKERDPAQFSTAGGHAGGDRPLPETYWKSEREIFRAKVDTARSTLWVLGLDDVRVYDTVKKELVRQVELPNWSVARFACMPDLALDRSGSAFISSNVQAKLWRIDVDSFEVNEHEISLLGRERWDVGFGALTFAADGTLLALTSTAGTLWKIDVATASAGMIEPNNPPSNGCAFTAQFLQDFERSR